MNLSISGAFDDRAITDRSYYKNNPFGSFPTYLDSKLNETTDLFTKNSNKLSKNPRKSSFFSPGRSNISRLNTSQNDSRLNFFDFNNFSLNKSKRLDFNTSSGDAPLSARNKKHQFYQIK